MPCYARGSYHNLFTVVHALSSSDSRAATRHIWAQSPYTLPPSPSQSQLISYSLHGTKPTHSIFPSLSSCVRLALIFLCLQVFSPSSAETDVRVPRKRNALLIPPSPVPLFHSIFFFSLTLFLSLFFCLSFFLDLVLCFSRACLLHDPVILLSLMEY